MLLLVGHIYNLGAPAASSSQAVFGGGSRNTFSVNEASPEINGDLMPHHHPKGKNRFLKGGHDDDDTLRKLLHHELVVFSVPFAV